MNKNLGVKLLVIIGVLLLFVYGIFGIPSGFSGSALLASLQDRIDQLGVSQPMIEEHGLGQYQILVQLPGIDDPARVKQVMQSTAMLEIRQVMGGPYTSQEAALQDKGGVMPEDSMLMPGKTNPDGTQTWYFVSRIPAVTGKDLRGAEPSRDQN